MSYNLIAEGKHGWEVKYKNGVKEADLIAKIKEMMSLSGVLRVVVRQTGI